MAEQTMIEKLALATKKGMDIHEASWDWDECDYNKDARKSFVEALESLDMDVRFAELLDLANYWQNDLNDWSEEILNE